MGRSGARIARRFAFALVLTLTLGLATARARAATDEVAGGLVRSAILRPVEKPLDKKMASRSACSFRHPLCVHGRAADERRILRVLALEDAAWDTATGALDLPAPDPDPATRAYDVYLTDGMASGALGATTVLSERDVRSNVDRASAFTLIDRALDGCALETAVARELLRAISFRVAPATDLGSARAETSYLARLMVPCAAGLLDGVEVFQAHPERALVDTWPEVSCTNVGVRTCSPTESAPQVGERFDRGAALFFWWLDDTFGAHPGAIVRAIWALTPTMTPLGATHWQGRPDAFDVLRTSFKGALSTGSTVDDLLLDFAVSRALLGDRADELHALETQALGEAARVHFDWDVPWPTTPRRLGAPAPMFPTGSAYVRVDHHGAPKGSRLRVEATWEEHAAMHFMIVKLDAAGHEMARVPIGAQDRGTSAQATVLDLDGVDAVLIVGINAGDRAVPFDPDDAIWEPHGWVVSVAAE